MKFETIGNMTPNGEEVKQLLKTGGYWYWDKHFPFLRFKEEEVLVLTEHNIYKWIEE
jgi:uncharacterized beta-barrel protein YwiB (DUF1934 family)